jgi:hypothetical protein
MIRIVTTDSVASPDRTVGKIVVESDLTDFPRAIDELNAPDARRLALAYANQIGIVPSSLNGNAEGPYAVNDDGVAIEDAVAHYQLQVDPYGQPVDRAHPKLQPRHFRIRVPVSSLG